VKLPRTIGIRHVALRCQALPPMERFYSQALGFKVVWRPDELNVYLSSGNDNLALHADASAKGESRLDHFGLMVGARLEVDAWYDWLRSQGVAIRSAPRDHRDGSRSLYAEDPEGNVVQILHVPGIGP
jgi:catechol 2,3-dioxygenase-like lactoylglutathione lyase family enzyme